MKKATLRQSSALALCVGLAAHGAGCNDPADSLMSRPGVPVEEGAAPDAPPVQAAYAPAGLKRLTSAQYANTIRDLFGDVTLPKDLEPDSRVYGFATVAAAQKGVSARAVQQFEAAARDVAKQVFTNEGKRAAIVGCVPTSPVDACVTAFITKFGRRVFRRALTDTEIVRFRNVSETVAKNFGGSVWAGLEYTAAALVQSPYFVFRIELGDSGPTSEPRKIKGYEMATRLSYLLWNTTPDDTLLDAAERGELDTRERMTAHVTRMLAEPRAADAIRGYVDDYFGLDRLRDLVRDPKVFPKMSATLGTSMREEVERLYLDVVERDGDLLSIFDTRETFVNAELAAMYGVAAPANGFAKVGLDASGTRGGLLGTAGILSIYSHTGETSPTLRGKFVREDVLCQAIQPPPPGVPSDLPSGPNTEDMTIREKLASHANNPTCAGCHNAMDPIGLGLENYDALGMFRTMEKKKTIDPSSTLNGVPFAGPAQLGVVLKGMAGVSRCMVSKLYRHATGHLAAPAEDLHIDLLAKDFDAAGHKFRALLANVATSDAFRYVGNPTDSTAGGK